MQIANPLYDVVFKYLMEDSKVAKLLLSAILGKEIVELDFRPQEHSMEMSLKKAKKGKKKSIEWDFFLSLYRLDFTAKIKTEKGLELIIIELQKAKHLQDLLRFRRYLGEQYSNAENTYKSFNIKGLPIRKGIPITSIYFLGEALEHIKGVPIVKVNRQVIDLYSGKEIKEREDFIESLTHESILVSIPELADRRRNELEKVLSIFDQSNRGENHHILNVREEEFPEKYREIIRRLQRAATEPEMRKKMTTEDEIMEQFNDLEELLEKKERELEEEKKLREEKEKKLEEEKKLREEKEKKLEEEKKLREEKEKKLEEEKRLREEKEKALEQTLKELEELKKKLKK
ncbi:MAG: hypothetical protein OHK0038_11200 [Flammeovirgaceae bacterium]